jgi:hypothetical protein
VTDSLRLEFDHRPYLPAESVPPFHPGDVVAGRVVVCCRGVHKLRLSLAYIESVSGHETVLREEGEFDVGDDGLPQWSKHPFRFAIPRDTLPTYLSGNAGLVWVVKAVASFGRFQADETYTRILLLVGHARARPDARLAPGPAPRGQVLATREAKRVGDVWRHSAFSVYAVLSAVLAGLLLISGGYVRRPEVFAGALLAAVVFGAIELSRRTTRSGRYAETLIGWFVWVAVVGTIIGIAAMVVFWGIDP